MTLDPAIFRALVARGATPEMLLAVVEADAVATEERAAKRRADTAARVRKHRGKDKPKAAEDQNSNAGNALQPLPSVTERYAKSDLPPNDIYSNPPSNPSVAKASEPPFAEKVVSAWNDEAASAGAQRSNPLTPKRRKYLAARVREVGEAGVLAAIRGLAASAWHTGHGSNGWRADLGWLLENAERIAKFSERADAEKPAVAPVADTSAYLAKIAAQPWMRGRENELEPQQKRNGASPPRGFGQLAAGIASGVTVQ